jgi:hypothetical protein
VLSSIARKNQGENRKPPASSLDPSFRNAGDAMMKLDMSALETQFGAPAIEDGGLLFDVDGAGRPAIEFPNCADVRNRPPRSPSSIS